MSRFLKFVILALSLLLSACGDNSQDFVNQNGLVTGATGTVTLQLTPAGVTAQFVPALTTDVRVSGVDDTDAVIFGPQTLPINDTIVIENVPISVVRIDGEFLDDGVVVKRFSEPVTVVENENVVVTNPTLLPSGPGDFNNLANDDFFLVALSAGSLANTFRGGVSFDGNGNVAGGELDEVNGATTIPFTGGNYNIDIDQVFSVELTTAGGNIEIGQGQVATPISAQSPPNSVLATLLGGENGNGLCYLVTRAQGTSVASLNGTFHFSILHNTGVSQARFGALTFDGAGNVTNGDIENFPAAAQSELRAGSTYTLNGDGDFTAQLNFGDAVFNLVGAMGQDGRLIFTAESEATSAGIGQLGTLRRSSVVQAQGIRKQGDLPETRFEVSLLVTDKVSGEGGVLNGTAAVSGAGNIEAVFPGLPNIRISGSVQFPNTTSPTAQSLTINDRPTLLGDPPGDQGSPVFVAASVDGTTGDESVQLFFQESDESVCYVLSFLRPVEAEGPPTEPPSSFIDVTNLFDSVDSSSGNGLFTIELLMDTSVIAEREFRFGPENNPTVDFSNITGCSGSVLDPDTFSTVASLTGSQDPDGACRWTIEDQSLPPVLFIFLDVVGDDIDAGGGLGVLKETSPEEPIGALDIYDPLTN